MFSRGASLERAIFPCLLRSEQAFLPTICLRNSALDHVPSTYGPSAAPPTLGTAETLNHNRDRYTSYAVPRTGRNGGLRLTPHDSFITSSLARRSLGSRLRLGRRFGP